MANFTPNTRPVQVEINLHSRLKKVAAATDMRIVQIVNDAIEKYIADLEKAVAKQEQEEKLERVQEYLVAKEMALSAFKKLWKKDMPLDKLAKWKATGVFAGVPDPELDMLIAKAEETDTDTGR